MAAEKMSSWIPVIIALVIGIAIGYGVALYTVPTQGGQQVLARGIIPQTDKLMGWSPSVCQSCSGGTGSACTSPSVAGQLYQCTGCNTACSYCASCTRIIKSTGA